MMQNSFWLASAPRRLGLCERGSLDYRWKFLCSALHDEEDAILAGFHVEYLAVVKHSALTDEFSLFCCKLGSLYSYSNANLRFHCCRELLVLVQTGNI